MYTNIINIDCKCTQNTLDVQKYVQKMKVCTKIFFTNAMKMCRKDRSDVHFFMINMCKKKMYMCKKKEKRGAKTSKKCDYQAEDVK